MIDCKYLYNTAIIILDIVCALLILVLLYNFVRFLHKNPEDPAEVPNGFVSDINSVSK